MQCNACVVNNGKCRNALARAGINTIHWETWSDCNLNCDFCYRSIRTNLRGEDSRKLIEAVAYGGASRLIFAGGDPSLRDDLSELCELANALSVSPEVQTNSQVLTASLIRALPHVRRIYVSIDGPNAATHDEFRDKRGNFKGVLQLLARTAEQQIPVTVHTVASLRNLSSVHQIAEVVNSFSHIDTWSISQFSAIGHGYKTRFKHQVPEEDWSVLRRELMNLRLNSARVSMLGVDEKSALYAMVSSDGGAYRAGAAIATEVADGERIGSMLGDHLIDLARDWQINEAKHQARYADS